jgi:hypothetical protein
LTEDFFDSFLFETDFSLPHRSIPPARSIHAARCKVVNTPISIRCGGGLGQCISLLECVPVNSDVYSRGLGSRFASDALIIDGDDECAGDVDRGGGTRSLWALIFSLFGKERKDFFLHSERKGIIYSLWALIFLLEQ